MEKQVKLNLGLREMWRDPYFSYTTLNIKRSLEEWDVPSERLFDGLYDRFLVPDEVGFGSEIKACLDLVLGVRSET